MFFDLFHRHHHRVSVEKASLLEGGVDMHCHILWGVDDGVKTQETSLKILQYLEEQGLREIWFTPHIMEDVPNTTEGLTERYNELLSVYTGRLKTHLAAEYMMDNL